MSSRLQISDLCNIFSAVTSRARC